MTPEAQKAYDKFIGDRTDESLISELKGLHDCLYVVECSGAKDHIRYGWLCHALDERGYEVDIEETLVIEEREDD